MNTKLTKQVNVDDCYFQWQFDDGTRCDDVYKAHGEKKDVYAVVLHHGNPPTVIYKEHRMCCHIDDAWRILQAGRFGKWKTAELLVTLRQALRERFAQCMPLDIPKDGLGEHALKAWMSLARAHDTVHHGQRTF
jgi:hypothetical protein